MEVSRNVEGTFPSVPVIAHMPRQSIPNRKFSESVDGKLVRLSWLFFNTRKARLETYKLSSSLNGARQSKIWQFGEEREEVHARGGSVKGFKNGEKNLANEQRGSISFLFIH